VVLKVRVFVEGSSRPPEGRTVRVQARDTALEDAPATTVAEALGTVSHGHGTLIDTVELRIADVPRHTTIWAHVDVDGDGRVSVGDYVTTTSYPVPAHDEAQVDVRVRLV